MNDFKLDSRPNIKSGFKAPDSYFESLTDRVMLSLPAQEVKVLPLYKRTPVWISSAAAVFVLSFSLLVSEKETTVSVSMPDSKSVANYITKNESGVSTSDLLDNLTIEDIKEMQEEAITVDDEYIGDYLSGESINLSDI